MTPCPSRSMISGFTLIESIIALVVLGIAAVTLTLLQGNLGKILVSGYDLQSRTQLQQWCSENILARRRDNGFDEAVSFVQANPNCSSNGQTVTMAVNSSYTGAGCPAGMTCALFSFSASGVSAVTLILPDYEL